MKNRTGRTSPLWIAVLAILVCLSCFALGCGNGEPERKSYPYIREFEDVGAASGEAGFEVRNPTYTIDGLLEGITLVEASADRKYVELDYSNDLTITEIPREEGMGYDEAMTEHQDYINRLPPELQTYEEPHPVMVGDHAGIVWTHKGKLITEERESTGVPSFHPPYLVWWDDELQCRVMVDSSKIYENGADEGIEQLVKVAESMYPE